MSDDPANFMLGLVILVVLIPVLYLVGRTAARIGDARSARLLAPLAPAIGGTVDLSRAALDGTYAGRAVRVFFAPRQAVGSGESATSINAFLIEVRDLPGHQDWRIRFVVSGMLGQGPKQLQIEVADHALGERLEQAGVLAAVASVSAPTDAYVTVAYAARQKVLTYTDDVSPRYVPAPDQFAAHLALVACLADINAQVNPPQT